MRIPGKAPSRANKKQLVAHLEPSLADRVRLHCHRHDLTFQEIMAMAVNASVTRLSDGDAIPFLRVSRQRVFRRSKSPAAPRASGPESRKGKRRIAAFYASDDADRVRSFARERGVTLEALVAEGLRSILGEAAEGLTS